MKQSFSSMIPKPETGREKDDFYPTPVCAVEALLKKERFLSYILDPCCGSGNISKTFKNREYIVYSSDLVNRGYGSSFFDFLEVPTYYHPFKYKLLEFDIVCNPPFKHSQEFVEKALSLNKSRRIIIFEKLTFLESKKRKIFFESTPIYKVYIFSWRVPIWKAGIKVGKKKGKGMAYAWYVWNKKYSGPPTIHWL